MAAQAQTALDRDCHPGAALNSVHQTALSFGSAGARGLVVTTYFLSANLLRKVEKGQE